MVSHQLCAYVFSNGISLANGKVVAGYAVWGDTDEAVRIKCNRYALAVMLEFGLGDEDGIHSY